MAELTPIERMTRIRALLVKTKIEVHKLRNEDELDAVVNNISEKLQNLGNRITILENNLDLVEMTISTANG